VGDTLILGPMIERNRIHHSFSFGFSSSFLKADELKEEIAMKPQSLIIAIGDRLFKVSSTIMLLKLTNSNEGLLLICTNASQLGEIEKSRQTRSKLRDRK
jgi:hypothetical protein